LTSTSASGAISVQTTKSPVPLSVAILALLLQRSLGILRFAVFDCQTIPRGMASTRFARLHHQMITLVRE
jgi:hypothetical protein